MNSPTPAGGFIPTGVVYGSIASEPTLGAGGGGSNFGEGGHDVILGG